MKSSKKTTSGLFKCLRLTQLELSLGPVSAMRFQALTLNWKMLEGGWQCLCRITQIIKSNIHSKYHFLVPCTSSLSYTLNTLHVFFLCLTASSDFMLSTHLRLPSWLGPVLPQGRILSYFAIDKAPLKKKIRKAQASVPVCDLMFVVHKICLIQYSTV